MTIYKQDEWLEKEADEGCTIGIGGVVLKNGVIASLSVNQWKDGLVCRGIWYSKPGKRDYRLEEDGTVTKIENGEDKIVSKVKPSNVKIGKKIVLPFARWFKDYVPLYNSRHVRKEDHIKGISIDGLFVNMDGTARELRITEDHGIFKIDDIKVDATDILVFNYGIARNDCFDDWDRHSYFNEDYDLVFDDDGKYHHNGGYNNDYFGKGKCGLEDIGLKFA